MRVPHPGLQFHGENFQNLLQGDLDSFALPFVMHSTGISLEDAEKLLCQESGLKALSGGYNDFRDIEEQAAQGNTRAKLALDVFIQQARHWIGAFFLELNGADALVFTAGIGENRPAFRQAVCANLNQLGLALDSAKNNAAKAQEAVISAADSRVKVLVIPTNEELVVAREVKSFLENSPAKNSTRGARKADPVVNKTQLSTIS